MQRLILLRHAKAATQAGGGDIERPLTSRGRADALRVGRYLQAEHLIADLAVVSAAKRTRETLDLVLGVLGNRPPVHVEPRLYHADPLILIAQLQQTPPEVRTLLVVGHNPGIAELAQTLAGHGDRFARRRLSDGFPTAALAVLDFDRDSWSDVDFGLARLDRYIVPDDLPA